MDQASKRRLKILTGCSIYRDGGSYGAHFITESGEGYHLWLERHPALFLPTSQELQPRHCYLFEAWGPEIPSPYHRTGIPVCTGSVEEQDILQQLDRFMRNPRVEVLYQYNPNEYYLERLVEMAQAVRERSPCFPADLLSAPIRY